MSVRSRYSSAIGACAILVAACSPEQITHLLATVPPLQAPVLGTVQGRVVDAESGEAVSDAVLAVGTAAKTASASDGAYEVSQLPAGTHFLRGDADGYMTFFGEVRVAGGMTVFDVPLRRSATTGTADEAGETEEIR